MNDRAALVEKVARALCAAADDNWEWSVFYIVDANDTAESAQDLYRGMASTALDLALEEAARVADEKEDEWTVQWRAGLKADSHLEGKSDGACEIAAAIRALKGKP